MPEEGSNLWVDSIVIPKTARNVEGAHKFINFMLDPRHAARNTRYVNYSTPNKTALALLPARIRNDKRFYPDKQTIKKLEVYQNIGKRALSHYSEMFLQFKMYSK